MRYPLIRVDIALRCIGRAMPVRALIGAIIVLGSLVGPRSLSAAERVVVQVNPLAVAGEVSAEVDGSRLVFEYRPAAADHQAHVVVRGHNPGAGRQTLRVRVTVFSSGPAVFSEAFGDLSLAPAADGAVTIPMSVAIPAEYRIMVGLEDVVRYEADAPTPEQAAQAPTALQLDGEELTFSVEVVRVFGGAAQPEDYHPQVTATVTAHADPHSPLADAIASLRIWDLLGNKVCSKPTLVWDAAGSRPSAGNASTEIREVAVIIDVLDQMEHHHLVRIANAIERRISRR